MLTGKDNPNISANDIADIREKEADKSPKKATALFCLLMIGAYLVISPMVSHDIYYKLLFPRAIYPAGYYKDSTVDGIKAQDVYFNAGNEKLHGWYFHNPDSKKLVLMHHGNGFNLSILKWYAHVVLKSGASILVYDYEGYGRSSGTPSIAAVCRDAEAAYQFATNDLKWKDQDIVEMGLSLGSGLATMLAGKHNNAGLILLASYTSLHKTCRSVLPWLSAYPDALMHEQDINSIENIGKVKCPVLIFHGNKDQMMPLSNASELKVKSKTLTQVVELNCGHGDLYKEQGKIHRAVKTFLNAIIPAAKASDLSASAQANGLSASAQASSPGGSLRANSLSASASREEKEETFVPLELESALTNR